MVKLYVWLFIFFSFRAQAAVPKCAIFLVPGAFSERSTGALLFLNAKDYFKDYLDTFAQWGCVTGVAKLPVDSSIEAQALALRNQVAYFAEQSGVKSVTLFAHSQGALDARYALHDLGLNKTVTALVSIGSPNDGTPLANWAVEQVKNKTFFYYSLKWIGSYDLKSLSFLGEMEPGFIESHAVHFSQVPGIHYASARGVCNLHCHWVFRLLEKLTVHVSPGDGVVPASSQSFGEDLGDYDLDHITEVSSDPVTHSERMRFLERAEPILLSR